MPNLLLAAAAFLAIHLLVSGTRLRDRLVKTIGQGAYMGLFSLASVVIIVWLCLSYGAAKTTGPIWWGPTAISRHIQAGLMLLAFVLVVPGLLTPNPTSVAQEGTLAKPDVVSGMLRLTRHPFLWGVAVWAIGHLIVNGDLPSLAFFGSFLVLAIAGTFSIDAKRQRTLGPEWTAFAGSTSNLPFWAILSGRQTFRPSEIGWVRLAAAVAGYVVILAFHKLLFGVAPLG
jgi:uncharacterized membrane protein